MSIAGNMKSFFVIAAYAAIIVAAGAGYGNHAWADGAARVDNVLEGISAAGISVTGDLSNNCSTAQNSICTGTFDWTDSHSNDASSYKGAIHMDGYVQQNLTSNININTTQGAVAAGANVIGDVTPAQGGVTINLTNNNNATGFIGGF